MILVWLWAKQWSMAAFWVLKDSLLFLITKEAKNLRDRNRQVLRMYLIAVLTGLGTLPGMMGTMMAHETLKLIIDYQL
jgi:hypothetical protein